MCDRRLKFFAKEIRHLESPRLYNREFHVFWEQSHAKYLNVFVHRHDSREDNEMAKDARKMRNPCPCLRGPGGGAALHPVPPRLTPFGFFKAEDATDASSYCTLDLSVRRWLEA